MNPHAYRNLALILFLFAACLQPVPSVSAQDGGLGDPFDDPTLPDWQVEGPASVEDGRLILPAGASVTSRDQWSDLELFSQVRMTGAGEFVISRQSSRGIDLSLIVGGSYATLLLGDETVGQAPIETIPEGEWFMLELVSLPTVSSVEINGQMVFELEPIDGLDSGTFSLQYQGPGQAEVEFVEASGSRTGPSDQAPNIQPTEDAEAEPPEASEPSADSARPPAFQAGPWVQLGGPLGGLGYDIRYDYFDHDTWYVTEAWAGIHRSTDRGLTWQPANEGITATRGVDGIPIFTVTVDHHEPDVVWVGTDITGQIYRSTNGGDSWQEMSNGIDPNMRPLTFRGITIHPTDQKIMYAMAEIASPAWTPDGESRAGIEMDLTKGIVFKSTDGGQNWQEVWRGDSLARYGWINPDDPETVYVSTGIFDRESANTDVEAGIAGGVGILKTTDGGQTWQVFDQDNGLLDLYIGSLYMHPEDPETLLAAAAQNNWSKMTEEFSGGIYITHDGGENWERLIAHPEMYGAVEYCEADPDIAYAASDAAVYRSQDGGETWVRYSRDDNTWGPPGIIAGIPIDMQCDPDDPDRIFVNNYIGGNFLSEDGGETWVNASKGYTGSLMNAIRMDVDQPGWVYAGGRSGLFRSTDGGETWAGTAYPAEEFSGTPMIEIASLAIKPSNPRWLLTTASDLARVVVSEDAGNSWSLVEGIDGSPGVMAFAPSDGSIVYAAVTNLTCIDGIQGDLIQDLCADPNNRFFKSTDSGQSWLQVGGDSLPGNGITTFQVHPQESEVIFAGTLAGGYAKSTDGGQSWLELNPRVAGDRPARTVAVDPNQTDTIFLGFDEFGLYKSTDGGTSWRKISAGLAPEAKVFSVLFDPTDSSVLYLADRGSGVYLSTDGGETWQPLNEGLNHRTALNLAISNDGTVLYVSIEGAGVYRLGTPPPVQGAEDLMSAAASSAQGQNEPSTSTDGSEAEGEQSDSEAESRGLPISCPLGSMPLILAISLLWLRRRRSD